MFLQPNVQELKFINYLQTAIKEKRGFSVVRFGDGEIQFLKKQLSPPVEERIHRGDFYKTTSEAIECANKILYYCLTNTDFIGVMDFDNIIFKRLRDTKTSWGIPHSLLSDLNRKKRIKVVDHMIFRDRIFGNPKNFKKVINGERICIVHPFVDKMKDNGLEKILQTKIRYIKTPYLISMKTEDQNRMSLFNKLDSIEENIVLYGCSIRAKDIGCYLASRNKIALDYGATLDAWAGVISRGWFNKGNLQEYCLIK